MRNAIAVVGALAAAAMFGVSSVLMFRAAAQATAASTGAGWHPLRGLSHSRLWWTAAALQALSFGVQALALAFGPLALVQPVAATDLLFALPLLARWQQRHLRRRDWTGAGLVAVGVATFLGVSPPRAGTPTASPNEWTTVVLAVTAVAVAAVAAAHVLGRAARTTLLAFGGAAAFGLVDALSKNFVGHVSQHGLDTTLASWEPYALAVAGGVGIALSQLTFRSGSLQISLPVIDTVEPTAAVVIGTIVFHEALATSVVRFVVQLMGAVIAVVGIAILDRSWTTAEGAHSGLSALSPAPRTEQGRGERGGGIRDVDGDVGFGDGEYDDGVGAHRRRRGL
jgi:hypothetical protein